MWRHPLHWMLGDDVLVAPVTELGASVWSTYLPAGYWIDAWAGSATGGGWIVVRPVSIDEIPIYGRASAWSELARIFAD